MQKLLIATKNAGKIREIKELLKDLPITVKDLSEFEEISEPAETGATFAENAALKAVYYAAATGVPALADDSGLEVDALGGAPGIFSARYAGEKASDKERISKLLSELGETAAENRGARFVCAMAVADEQGAVKFLTEGLCRGKIAFAASGANGFGYDPIFVPDGFSDTFGVISDNIKQKISHRAAAIDKIVGFLRDFIVV